MRTTKGESLKGPTSTNRSTRWATSSKLLVSAARLLMRDHFLFGPGFLKPSPSTTPLSIYIVNVTTAVNYYLLEYFSAWLSSCDCAVTHSIPFHLQLRSLCWPGAVRRWVRTRALPALGNSGWGPRRVGAASPARSTFPTETPSSPGFSRTAWEATLKH